VYVSIAEVAEVLLQVELVTGAKSISMSFIDMSYRLGGEALRVRVSVQSE
jgi:hypothetical protein